MVIAFKILYALLVRDRVVHPAQTDLSVVRIVIVSPVIPHTNCIPVMYFTSSAAYGAFLMFYTLIQICIDVICPVGQQIRRNYTILQTKIGECVDE